MTLTHFIEGSAGETFELGIIRLRLLVQSDQTGGAFSVGEFSGGEGVWTVPHVHRNTEESFYVLEGTFTFSLGREEIAAGPGAFILVPRGTSHNIRVDDGLGRLLALWSPGGLEAMFVKLSQLPGDSLRDREVRKMMSARFDSIPV